MLSRRSYHQWWLVVNGSNPHRRWPRVSHGIIRYSFFDLGRMETWVDLAAQGYNEICWHDHHENSNRGRSHGSKIVNPLCVFALKSSYCKTFRKTVKNPRKDSNFLLLSGFFSEHRYGFAFAMISCLQKVKVGKKKVLERSSFDNLFLIISLTSSSITTTLWKKLNFKILKSV